MSEDVLLLDTSAWILSFKSSGYSEAKTKIRQAIENDRIVTAPPVILEIVQGCRTESEKNQIQFKMRQLGQLVLTDSVWDVAYDMGFQLKRKGATVPTMDIILASCAIHYQCILVHRDKHYAIISQHFALSHLDMDDLK